MKKYQFILYVCLTMVTLIGFNSCVHDDDYNSPQVGECTNLTATTTIAELKDMYQGSPIRIIDDLILEGYVVSSDESGNIYKTLYIQDAPINPTHGFTISVDKTDLYTQYPIGYKVFIKLKDLWLGEYGGVIQLGDMGYDAEIEDYAFGRIPLQKVDTHIILGCEVEEIVPLEMPSMQNFNSNLVGALIQINNVEVSSDFICEPFSFPEQTVNRIIQDCNNSSVLLRNSGYATFTNQTMPSGNGSMIAILSAYNNSYQLYIRDASDMVAMNGPRCDGEVVDCNPNLTANATIQDIKDQYSGGLTQINSDLIFDGVITANDDTGNLYKLVYLEDETGGIRLRLNKTNLHYNPKYYIGSKLMIKAQDLYIDDSNGELHLGGLYNGSIGNIEEDQIYLHVFGTNQTETVTPTALDLASLTTNDIGKLITLSGVEFIDSDVDQSYAGTTTTNRTLQDCNGNTILVRTSNFATFASEATPGGNGDITAILSNYNGTYQLWLRNTNDVNLTNVRCDGSTPATSVFFDGFDNGLANWTTQSVTGDNQFWQSTTFGNPAPCAVMSGYSGGAVVNEDWLVSNAIDLTGFTAATFSFDNVKRYAGDDIEAYYTTNFTGDVTTTTWTQLSPILDTNTGSWSSWTSSGPMDISSAAGGNVYVAIKYTSTSSAAASWEVDNVKISAN